MHLGSIEAVVLAIQEDARAETERIERELDASIKRLREEGAATPVVVPDADTRVSAARQQVRDRLAAQDWTDRQAALSAREAWIQRVVAAGERRLRSLDAAAIEADFVDLVREAVEHMPKEPLELLVPTRHLARAQLIVSSGDGTQSGKPLTRVAVSDDIESGCIVQTADGRIRYENSYESRARRFEAAWRMRLGEAYQELPAHDAGLKPCATSVSEPCAASVSPEFRRATASAERPTAREKVS